MLNNLEKIPTKTELDNQIKDKCTVKYNVTFDIIIHKNSHRGHSPP
jgi:glutathione peroxidase-family protein